MGYYSDVALALNEKGRTLLNQKLASSNTAAVVRYDVSRLLEHASQHKYDAETKSECWLWQGVKWFAVDPAYYRDIHFIESVLEELDESDYYFVRIGEDTDDNEIRGLWFDNPFEIVLHREIVLDS